MDDLLLMGRCTCRTKHALCSLLTRFGVWQPNKALRWSSELSLSGFTIKVQAITLAALFSQPAPSSSTPRADERASDVISLRLGKFTSKVASPPDRKIRRYIYYQLLLSTLRAVQKNPKKLRKFPRELPLSIAHTRPSYSQAREPPCPSYRSGSWYSKIIFSNVL